MLITKMDDDFDRVSQMTGISEIYSKKSALEQHRLVYVRNKEETSMNEAAKLKPVDVITPIYQACEEHAKNGHTGIRVCPDTNLAKSQASTLEIIKGSLIKRDPKTFQPLIYDLDHLELEPFINKKVNSNGEIEFLPGLEKFENRSIQEVMYTKYGVWVKEFRFYPYLHSGLKCMFSAVWDSEFEPVKKWKEGLSYDDALIALMPVRRIGNIPNKSKKTYKTGVELLDSKIKDSSIKEAVPVSEKSFKKLTLKDLDVLFFMNLICPWSTKMKKVLEKEGFLDDVTMVDITTPEGKKIAIKYGADKITPNFVSRKLKTGTIGYKETVQMVIDALNSKGPEDYVVAEEIKEKEKGERPRKFLGLF